MRPKRSAERQRCLGGAGRHCTTTSPRRIGLYNGGATGGWGAHTQANHAAQVELMIVVIHSVGFLILNKLALWRGTEQTFDRSIDRDLLCSVRFTFPSISIDLEHRFAKRRHAQKMKTTF